jgi:hypothetical protein
MMKKNALLVSLAMTVALVGTAAVQAQTAPQQAPKPQMQPPATAPQANYPDTQVQAFANAVKAVDEIAQVYQPKLAAVTQPADAQKIQAEANAQMMKVVQDQGLTPQQYNEMHQSIKQDPALLEKVRGYME